PCAGGSVEGLQDANSSNGARATIAERSKGGRMAGTSRSWLGHLHRAEMDRPGDAGHKQVPRPVVWHLMVDAVSEPRKCRKDLRGKRLSQVIIAKSGASDATRMSSRVSLPR